MSRKLFGIVFGSLASILLTLGDTLAQQGQSAVEEIVVRARKRSEALEEVPVAVTVMTAADLDAAQVSDIGDLQQFVPNLSIRRGRTGRDASIYIRGVGTQSDDVFLDQAVGVYIDGVYMARTAGSVIDLLDFEQVEVLRGPQGTLFGKNTVGGAINITTVKPQPELSGRVTVRAGNYDLVETRATLNVPLGRGALADKLLGRFAFGSRNTSGYTENTFLDVNWNDEAMLNFLGSVRFLPTDYVTIDVSGQWTRSQSHGRGGECVYQRLSQFDGLPGGATDEYYNYCGRTPPQGDSLGFLDSDDPFEFESNVGGLSDLKSYGTWATATWEVGRVEAIGADDVSFKVIGAWREQVQRLREDIDMSRFPIFQWSSAGGDGFNGDPGVAHQETLELQSNTSFLEERLSLVSGAFFYWEHVDTEFDYLVFPESPISAPSGGLTKSAIVTDNFSWAVFLHGVLDITDWMSLTAGVRYTNEDKGASRRLENLVVCGDDTPPPCAAEKEIAGFDDRSKSFDQVTPMATLTLTAPEDWLDGGPVDHLLTYFTYSEGFKGGGINAAIRTDDPRELGDFDPEKLRSYELGLKTIGFDRRLRASLAGYYGQYSDLQLPTVVAGICPPENPDCIPAPLYIVDNAAEATIAGAELEMALDLWDGLTLTGSASYQFAEYDDYEDATDVLKNPNDPDERPPTINRNGERLPFVPRFSSHVGLQYALAINGGDHLWLDGTLTPRLDWSYRSSVQYWGRELSGNVQSGYNLLNARLGYLFYDDMFELALWSRNLTDETYFDEVYQIPALVVGNITRFYAAPRTFGGEVTFRF